MGSSAAADHVVIVAAFSLVEAIFHLFQRLLGPDSSENWLEAHEWPITRVSLPLFYLSTSLCIFCLHEIGHVFVLRLVFNKSVFVLRLIFNKSRRPRERIPVHLQGGSVLLSRLVKERGVQVIAELLWTTICGSNRAHLLKRKWRHAAMARSTCLCHSVS